MKTEQEEKNNSSSKGDSPKSWLFFSKKAAEKVNGKAYTILILIGVAVIITIVVLGSLGLLPAIG